LIIEEIFKWFSDLSWDCWDFSFDEDICDNIFWLSNVFTFGISKGISFNSSFNENI
jgi:hypothetical protein